MNKFIFHQSIEVRYSDLDPQWHVNNARFLSFVEHARFKYLIELGLFDGRSFNDLPLIVGDMHCRYFTPIEPGDIIEVWLGVTEIGNRSLVISSELTSQDGNILHAKCDSTMVGYDYKNKKSTPISDEMRKRISEYEGKDFTKR